MYIIIIIIIRAEALQKFLGGPKQRSKTTCTYLY